MHSEVDWAEFAFAVLLIELTPGPNMGWLAALSLTEGRRAGLAATAGVALGLAVNALLAGLGLAALVRAEPGWQAGLRWAGALLMLWLAWQAWSGADSHPKARPGAQRHFASGLLVNLLNPKAFVFFVAVVPPFLDGRAASMTQALAFAAISVTIATTVHLALVFTAARAHGWVSDPARTRLVRRLMALAMVAVAAWLAMGRVG